MADKILRPGESEITYMEGEDTRVLRGTIIEETDDYITVKRDDGTRKIYKSRLVTIRDPPEDKK